MRREFSGACRAVAATMIVATPFLPSSAMAQEGDEDLSLKSVTVPLPDNLSDCVTDMDALLKLGKAAFWDMQFGSDGKTACATCHFAAGADPRTQNQINPGSFDDNTFDTACDGNGGPNATLDSSAWPFHKLAVPDDNDSMVIDDYDDTFSSQGVVRQIFTGVNGTAVDDGIEELDPDGFSIGGYNVRRVEPRNTPSVINAVFFHRLFADGRANHFFNGVNIFGNQDTSATILVKDGDGPAMPQAISFNNAALASQAVGPVLSRDEMSWDGRDWCDVGRKMLSKTPLAGQVVHTMDSVLGTCANPDEMVGGLLPADMTYEDMVKAAFDPKFWCDEVSDFDGYSQIEANFSLFFGLAILKYESTLVADDTPLDRYLYGGGEGGTHSDELTAQEKHGFDLFMNDGGCNSCHELPELGGAAISKFYSDSESGEESETLVEFMAMANTGAEGCAEWATEPKSDDVYPLTLDPRSQIIDIMGPIDYETGDFGTAVFGGVLAAPGTGPGECWEMESEFALRPWNGVPYAGAPMDAEPTLEEEFGVFVSINVSDDCSLEMEICIETGFPGIPEGDYMVVIDGCQMGVISMPKSNPPAFYDSGFYNIGTTPTERDLGAGQEGPFGPFSLTRRLLNGEDIGQSSGLSVDPQPGDRIAVDGAFRTPQLRNIELTGPYMHNGGLLTLEQVVDFYVGGAHFEDENQDDLDPDVDGISGMTASDKAALAAFMKRPLTDERVLYRRAPFDHPSLCVPNGHGPMTDGMAYEDDVIDIEAVGAYGAAEPLRPFHERVTAAISVAPIEPLHLEEDMIPLGRQRAAILAARRAGGRAAQSVQNAIQFPDDENVARTIRLYMPIEPESTVHISALFDKSDIMCKPSSVTFSPENWFEPQEIKVYGLRDQLVEGEELVQIGWLTRTSDARYASAFIPTCDVMISDPPGPILDTEIEAEDGLVTAPMEVETDFLGNTYVWTPSGPSMVTDPATQPTGQLRIDFEVNAPQAEMGPVWAWVYKKSPSVFTDDMFVSVDGQAWEHWKMQTVSGWHWERISVNDVDRSWDLEAGSHTLTFAHGDTNAKIDKVIFTNDPNFDPAQP